MITNIPAPIHKIDFSCEIFFFLLKCKKRGRRMMHVLLEVKDLVGGYTRKPVLKNISFIVESNSIVGLIGLNGAGKSTTIKHITGLMEQKNGRITINGRSIQDDPDNYRGSFTFIPETPILYEELTLQEHLELTAMAYGLTKEEMNQKLPPLLKEFRMEKS